ncbi:hypothetical protein BC832DRAFT_613550 [Gaertneriomyces semiglobifer]|nr:hypothetical protein BC832DRAFT_613550 [Gaertneriomyces semiglobifer]
MEATGRGRYEAMSRNDGVEQMNDRFRPPSSARDGDIFDVRKSLQIQSELPPSNAMRDYEASRVSSILNNVVSVPLMLPGPNGIPQTTYAVLSTDVLVQACLTTIRAGNLTAELRHQLLRALVEKPGESPIHTTTSSETAHSLPIAESLDHCESTIRFAGVKQNSTPHPHCPDPFRDHHRNSFTAFDEDADLSWLTPPDSQPVPPVAAPSRVLPTRQPSRSHVFTRPLESAPTTEASNANSVSYQHSPADMRRQGSLNYLSNSVASLSSPSVHASFMEGTSSAVAGETHVTSGIDYDLEVPRNTTRDSNEPLLNSADKQEETASGAKSDSQYERAEEPDKRRRNTTASARFRAKKKLREQAMERAARELTQRAEGLGDQLHVMHREVQWVRDLLIDRDGRETLRDLYHQNGLLWPDEIHEGGTSGHVDKANETAANIEGK